MAIQGELPLSLDPDGLLAFRLAASRKQAVYAQQRYEWTEPQLRAFAQHQRELHAARVGLVRLLQQRRTQNRSLSG